jgi:hypothetical protein
MHSPLRPAALLAALALFVATSPAQDRLKTVPGCERFTTMGRESVDAVKPGTLAVTWVEDGNLTGDGRWLYSWDAENRLASTESTAAVRTNFPALARKLLFTYDHLGRRAGKAVYAWDTTSQLYALTSHTGSFTTVAEPERRGTRGGAADGAGSFRVIRRGFNTPRSSTLRRGFASGCSALDAPARFA